MLLDGLAVELVSGTVGDTVAMSVRVLLHVVLVHGVAKVGKGCCSVDGVAVDARVTTHTNMWPGDRGHPWCGGGLAALRV